MLASSIPNNNRPERLDANQLIVETCNQQKMSVDEATLTSAARTILADHGIDQGELSIAIVDDPAIRVLNRQYLNHDYETDVISFVLDEDEATGQLDGQLIVSTDTAAREASNAGWTFEAELLLYVVHGTLHLVGFDDKDPTAVPEMRSAEAKYMAKFGFPIPTVAQPEELGS
jgi:probable rRNA maturation factor